MITLKTLCKPPALHITSLKLRVTGGWEASTIDGSGDNSDKILGKWPARHTEAGHLMPPVRGGSGATSLHWKSRTPKTHRLTEKTQP